MREQNQQETERSILFNFNKTAAQSWFCWKVHLFSARPRQLRRGIAELDEQEELKIPTAGFGWRKRCFYRDLKQVPIWISAKKFVTATRTSYCPLFLSLSHFFIPTSEKQMTAVFGLDLHYVSCRSSCSVSPGHCHTSLVLGVNTFPLCV